MSEPKRRRADAPVKGLASTVGRALPPLPAIGSAPPRQPTRLVPPPLVVKGIFPCAGVSDCNNKVTVRDSRCPDCEDEVPRRARRERLGRAIESVSPEGCRDECRAGTPFYEKTTARLRAAIPHYVRLEKLDAAERGTIEQIIVQAALPRNVSGMLIIGPTGIGKSKLLVALAHALIDAAINTGTPEAMRVATGVRYINGQLLAEEQRAHAAGNGRGWIRDVNDARDASVLFADEIGYEGNPELMKYILRARYERRSWMPVYAASNAPLSELHRIYGENNVRTIWENGVIFDFSEASRIQAGRPPR